MKTYKEIQDLKENWLSDPCWDIEDTPEFEEHYEYLKKFRIQKEQEWSIEYEQRVSEWYENNVGISEVPHSLKEYLYNSQAKYRQLQEEMYDLERRLEEQIRELRTRTIFRI